MSYKLAKWIENEFDRNAWFFGEFKGGLMAACEFIDFVLIDNDFLNLDEQDKKYVATVRSCYSRIKELSNEMVKEIGVYKKAFTELFADEEFILTENGYEVREIEIE